MRWAVVAVLALGCVTAREREERLARRQAAWDAKYNKPSPWVGRSIGEAVSAMGPPAGNYPNGATTLVIWTYEKPEAPELPQHEYHTSVAGAVFGGLAEGIQMARYERWASGRPCRIWFEVDGEGTILARHEDGLCPEEVLP